MSLSQQMVQASHAALEAGLKDNNKYEETSSIIIFQIPNQEELVTEFKYIQSLGIDCVSFFEPYENTGITAFSTLPITENQRHYFKKYTLWGRPIKGDESALNTFLKLELKESQKKKKQQSISIEQSTTTLEIA